MEFKRMGDYWAKCGRYAISWTDEPRLFIAYHDNNFLGKGTRQEVIDICAKHQKDHPSLTTWHPDITEHGKS